MNFYDFKLNDNKGNPANLDAYKGKVLLVVNTATKCGLTPQYEELEKIYQKYKDKGFELLDFPCNQFLEQAPGSDEEIETFCTTTYNTTFPRFELLDFPCNQFLEQAPGSDEEIETFCTTTYNTTFPRFEKLAVNGDDAHPLYKWLKEEKPADKSDAQAKEFEGIVAEYTKGAGPADIKWNFGKFLIDKQGNVVERYSPNYTLASLEKEIEEALAK